MSHAVTLIPGDGVGPEIASAARRIIEAAGVDIAWEEAEAGAEVFKRGDTLRRAARDRRLDRADRGRAQGPARDPGRLRREVGQRHAAEALRDVREHPPGSAAAGRPDPLRRRGRRLHRRPREHRGPLRRRRVPRHPRCRRRAQDHQPRRARRRSSATRSSWPSARAARKVTCATKANILKLTEGLFKRVFEELAPEYPDIEPQHLIIDNVAHQMAKDPAQFDVIVTTNLAGDIISDLASGLVGGLGFAASGNYGDEVAIFEAVHGSAPKYAGKNVINPTALVLSSVMMLRHLGEHGRRPADRGRGLRHARGGSRGHARRRAPDGRRRGGDLDDGLHRRRSSATSAGRRPTRQAAPVRGRTGARRPRRARAGSGDRSRARALASSAPTCTSRPTRSRRRSVGRSRGWPAPSSASSSISARGTVVHPADERARRHRRLVALPLRRRDRRRRRG